MGNYVSELDCSWGVGAGKCCAGSWMERCGWPNEMVRVATESATHSKERHTVGAHTDRESVPEVVVPIAKKLSGKWWYRALRRVISLGTDSSCVAESDRTGKAFGRRAASRAKRSAYPQVRVVGFVETETHVFLERRWLDAT